MKKSAENDNRKMRYFFTERRGRTNIKISQVNISAISAAAIRCSVIIRSSLKQNDFLPYLSGNPHLLYEQPVLHQSLMENMVIAVQYLRHIVEAQPVPLPLCGHVPFIHLCHEKPPVNKRIRQDEYHVLAHLAQMEIQHRMFRLRILPLFPLRYL